MVAWVEHISFKSGLCKDANNRLFKLGLSDDPSIKQNYPARIR